MENVFVDYREHSFLSDQTNLSKSIFKKHQELVKI